MSSWNALAEIFNNQVVPNDTNEVNSYDPIVPVWHENLAPNNNQMIGGFGVPLFGTANMGEAPFYAPIEEPMEQVASSESSQNYAPPPEPRRGRRTARMSVRPIESLNRYLYGPPPIINPNIIPYESNQGGIPSTYERGGASHVPPPMDSQLEKDYKMKISDLEARVKELEKDAKEEAGRVRLAIQRADYAVGQVNEIMGMLANKNVNEEEEEEKGKGKKKM